MKWIIYPTLAFLAFALTIAISRGAEARVDLPPKQYDKPFKGKLTIVILSFAEMQRQCGVGRGWACYAYTYGNINGRCTIYITSKDPRSRCICDKSHW